MRHFSLLFALALTSLFATAQKDPLTLDAIFVDGGAAGRAPQEGKWSPDGTAFTYILRSRDGSQGDLWALDPKTGNTAILVANTMLSRLNPAIDKVVTSEREKERLTRYAVAGYLWRPDSKVILFSSAGHLYLYDLVSKVAHPVVPELGDLKDPKFSPDGKWVSFVKDYEIWIVPVAGGRPKRLTRGGSKDLLNGDLDWVYQEEFDVRTGYHWSPDSRHIAFLQLDQTGVGETPIVDFVTQPHASIEMQKYPKAGEKNPVPRIGLAALNGKVSWLNLAAEYVPRIEWADSKTLSVQLLNRLQNELDLVLWNVDSRKAEYVLKEREKEWVNVHDVLHFLPKDEILWGSERDGFRHLYVYDRKGRMLRRLTGGDWEVTAVNGVDTVAGWVYFTATEKSPIERHVYRVRLDGSGVERLSRQDGSHTVTMDPTNTYYVDAASSFLAPSKYAIGSISQPSYKLFFQSQALDRLDLITPEIVQLKAADGAPVRIMLLKPPEAKAGKKYPVLIYLYGGPKAPVISNAYGGERFLWHQWMAQRGYVVVYIDDRLSAIPGHKYETAVYQKFGLVELQDHRTVVEYLKSLPFVDGERIGLWGWSGGGYTTCFDLFNAADLFKVGVAVAPLTDFRDYDTIWTERYMGLPKDNPQAYEKSSATTYASRLAGKLLLIHGTSDDNVHLQNTLQMAQQLIDEGKPFDIFLYPRKTHALAGTSTRRHLYQRIADYFDRYLKQ